MGNRAFIEVSSEQFEIPVVFYGHWSGDDNILAVRNVLERSGRIGDPSYLTAQLFYEFSKLGNYDGELSFGIYTGRVTGSEWADAPTVFVNADTGEYTYQDTVHSEFAVSVKA